MRHGRVASTEVPIAGGLRHVRRVGEREFHDELYGAATERIFASPLYVRLLARQVAFLRAVQPNLATARVLSLGCGDGRRELALAPYAGRIIAIDLSPAAIELARRRACDLDRHNVEFYVGDTAAVVDLGRFDAVWCGGLLHHLTESERETLVGRAIGALAPGGTFVAMDPNARRAVNILKPFVRRAYLRYHSPDEGELIPETVAALLRSAGFAAVEIHYIDWFISPLAWLLPGIPAPLAGALATLDSMLLRVPPVRRLASGFAAIGRAPASR